MSRKVPLIPTLVVVIAVAIMLRLGFWQLDRLHQKQAMLAQYAAAERDRAIRPWSGGTPLPHSYSLVSVVCIRVRSIAPQAGQNESRQAGWAQVAQCDLGSGGAARVVLGWSPRPDAVAWAGGPVSGTFLAKSGGNVIFADPPLAGLRANARPDPADVPNNHLAYAVQWFLFAGVALIIYVLALRKRSLPTRGASSEG